MVPVLRGGFAVQNEVFTVLADAAEPAQKRGQFLSVAVAAAAAGAWVRERPKGRSVDGAGSGLDGAYLLYHTPMLATTTWQAKRRGGDA